MFTLYFFVITIFAFRGIINHSNLNFISHVKYYTRGRVELKGNFLFAPCDETGAYSSDYSKWIRIGAERIVNNTISLLMFELPNSVVAGSYRIIVQTAYGSGTRVNKSVKCGVYDKIVNVS